MRVATLIGVFAGMLKVGVERDDVGVVPELDLAAEDLGEGASVEIDLRASRVGHGVEDTDGSELEGDVEERLAVGGLDGGVRRRSCGGLEGNIARTEVVLI